MPDFGLNPFAMPSAASSNTGSVEETRGEAELLIPDGIEPLVGWRGWDVDTETMTLTAATRSDEWPPGEIMAAACTKYGPAVEIELHNIPAEHFAVCRAEIQALVDRWAETYSDPHDTPNPGCRCGLYAKNDRYGIDQGRVQGRVRAWGKVVKGALGFRAQFARVDGLLYAPVNGWRYTVEDDGADHRELVDELARRYGVPVLDQERRTSVHEIRGRGDLEALSELEGALRASLERYGEGWDGP